jgi:hypothetical protein
VKIRNLGKNEPPFQNLADAPAFRIAKLMDANFALLLDHTADWFNETIKIL